MAQCNNQPIARGAALLGLVVLSVGPGPMARGQQPKGDPRGETIATDRGEDSPGREPRRDTVFLPSSLASRLGVRAEPVRATTHPGTLVLRGVLAIDPSRQIRIRPRFAGEVVDVGVTAGAEGDERMLKPGDRVTRGQLLAIVWSSELSQKKNELLNAFSRLSLERETFNRLKGLHKEGVISSRDQQEAKRELEEADIEAA